MTRIWEFHPDSNGIRRNPSGMYFLLEFPGMWMEFQWIPMEIIPGGSWKLPYSNHFQWIPSEFKWNGKPKWLRLQPTRFCWNSDIPLRIRRIPPELIGECKDLYGPFNTVVGYTDRPAANAVVKSNPTISCIFT
jgi:hypothetical protein